MHSVRIVLVDDHGLMRAGLRRLIETIPDVEVVAEAENGRDAIARVREHAPQLVLMDVALPVLNGLEACARITERWPEVAVLMLSMYANEEYVLRAMRNGALGYLLKSASASELELAIRAAVKGDRYLSPEISRHVIDAYVNRTQSGGSALDALTPRQREVLQLVAEGHTTREIAEVLHLGVKTVETHRTNIMRQIDVHDVVGLVRFAMRHGLLPDEDVPSGSEGLN